MESFKKLAVVSLLVAVSVGCGKKAEDFSVDADSAVLESGINSVSSLADESTGGAFARLQSDQIKPSIWSLLLVPEINASSVCQRPYTQSCSGASRSIQYSGCAGAGGLVSLDGTASLAFSGASSGTCRFNQSGDGITRTYNINFTGPRGGVLNLSSDSKADYTGANYGGGGQLSFTGASTWAVAVLGRHTTYSYDGVEYYSTSVRTTSAMTISNSLSRSSRVLNGGVLQVNHNIAGFTANFVPTNVTWSGGCYPSSGSIAVTYSGSKTGTATITFTGSGSATYTKDGESKTLDISYCE